MMVIVLDPVLRLIDEEADPDETEVPFTVIVEVESVAVGVTVIDEIPLATVLV